MSLEEKAKQISEKLDAIIGQTMMLQDLVRLVLDKRQFNGVTIQYTNEDKQKLIDHYKTKKTALLALVNELPQE